MLLGQQTGYTKCPCFPWEWDSQTRNQYWEKKICLQGTFLNLEALPKEGNYFKYLLTKFAHLSRSKGRKCLLDQIYED